MSFGIDSILAARQRISPYIVKTPLLRLENLEPYLGCRVFAKAECMQKTGSFKLRGAMNKVLSLPREDLDRGIVAVSSGNHGRAVAYAAKMFGLRATVIVPDTAVRVKTEAIKEFGYTADFREAGYLLPLPVSPCMPFRSLKTSSKVLMSCVLSSLHPLSLQIK